MTQKNIDTALILVPTKNRNYEIQRCLNSLKGDVEKSEKLNYALVVVIDDSTKTAIREKNRKVCEKIRSDIFKVFYFGLNEQFSLFNELKFYFENAKISPYEFTRTLGKEEWDLASVRNLSLIICRLLGATTDLIYLSDDDIIFPETIENSILRNDMANDRFSSLLDSFIYVFEEDNAKAVGALIEGDFDLSIFYQIDYAINRTKNFLLWAKNRNPEDNCKMYFWNEGRTGLEEYTNIGTTFIRICNMIKEIKERSPSIYRMGRKKFSLSTKDNKIRFMKSTTLSGGSMCISYDSIESHPFMHAYNEDWIWLRVLNPKNDGSTLQANIMTIQKPMKRDVASIKNIVRQQIGEILKEYIDQFAQRIKKPFSECTLDKEDIQMLALMRDKVLGKMVKLEKKINDVLALLDLDIWWNSVGYGNFTLSMKDSFENLKSTINESRVYLRNLNLEFFIEQINVYIAKIVLWPKLITVIDGFKKEKLIEKNQINKFLDQLSISHEECLEVRG